MDFLLLHLYMLVLIILEMSTMVFHSDFIFHASLSEDIYMNLRLNMR